MEKSNEINDSSIGDVVWLEWGALAQDTAPTKGDTDKTQTAAAPVKKSNTGICHAPGSSYYGKTKNFTPFKTVDECLKSGGRLPKR